MFAISYFSHYLCNILLVSYSLYLLVLNTALIKLFSGIFFLDRLSVVILCLYIFLKLIFSEYEAYIIYYCLNHHDLMAVGLVWRYI